MKIYASIIIFNNKLDKILLIEKIKNIYILPRIENKMNNNINETALQNLKIVNINYVELDFFTQIIFSDISDICYYIVARYKNNCDNINYNYSDDEYYDINFIDITQIIKKNIIDINISSQLSKLIQTKSVDYYQFLKLVPNYNKIRSQLLTIIRNDNTLINNDDGTYYLDTIIEYINNKYNKNYSDNDIYICIKIDVKNKIKMVENNNMIKIFPTYRHSYILKNLINDDILFDKININIYDTPTGLLGSILEVERNTPTGLLGSTSSIERNTPTGLLGSTSSIERNTPTGLLGSTSSIERNTPTGLLGSTSSIERNTLYFVSNYSYDSYSNSFLTYPFLHFIIITRCDEQYVKKIYKQYNSIYVLNIDKIKETNMIFYKSNDIILTRGIYHSLPLNFLSIL